nr:translocon-associated protein subunit alpha-like [Ipomoea batatas]
MVFFLLALILFSASSLRVTVCVFPKNPSKSVPAGEESELIVGMKNDGESTLNVLFFKATLHLPFDHRYLVQNLTTQGFSNSTIPPSAQATLPYIFGVRKFLQPGTFDLVGSVIYEINRQPYQNIFYNSTIEVTEPGGLVNVEFVFLVCLGIAFVALLGFWIRDQIQKNTTTNRSFVFENMKETSATEFIIPYDLESLKNKYSIGMRFKMRSEGEEASEQRSTATAMSNAVWREAAAEKIRFLPKDWPYTPVAANSTANGQTVSEKYGSWMLVSRRDRRNQSRRTYLPREGVPTDRRRAPREMTGFENLGTQSRFAALEGLDDTMVDQGQVVAEAIALQQANTTLPRIITNDRNKQRQTEQREITNYRLPRDSESGRGNQNAYQDTIHIPSREGSQNFFRGGYHWANRGNGRAAPRGEPQNTDRGGYPSTYRGNFHSSNGGFRGRHGKGGGPNQAAAEAEYTVVRGSNRGKNITSTVVVHEFGQSSHAMMPGFEHSPKEDPPDREGPVLNEFNFPDVAMTEGMGSDEPHGDMAESHMHS